MQNSFGGHKNAVTQAAAQSCRRLSSSSPRCREAEQGRVLASSNPRNVPWRAIRVHETAWFRWLQHLFKRFGRRLSSRCPRRCSLLKEGKRHTRRWCLGSYGHFRGPITWKKSLRMFHTDQRTGKSATPGLHCDLIGPRSPETLAAEFHRAARRQRHQQRCVFYR